MKLSKEKKDKITEILYGLSEKSTSSRNSWRIVLMIGICILLSVISMSITIFGGVEDGRLRLIVVVMSLIKYFPILWVLNKFAHKKAAQYLSDIFEINNDKVALDFIENAVLGHSGGRLGMKNMGYDAQSGKNIEKLAIIYNEGKITIKDGKLSEDDKESPVILIGGPGLVKVGLDHLVVFEDVNGRANILHPRDKPWKIGKYERLREINNQQYAIISLRDQFISGISIRSRTKDGIPIEAQDIKIIFSILRKKQKDDVNKDATFDPEAVKALVYGQTMISSETSQTFGATFPWDSTVIPLVVSEIENLIKTRPLNEILANIGKKEVEAKAKTDQSIETIKVEITGQQKPISLTTEPTEKTEDPENTSNFETRSVITARFYETEFVQKAARAGFHLQWIDIGTWKLPSEKIIEKHKDAWNRSRDNYVNRMRFEKTKNKKAQKEFAQLVDETIINKYEKVMGTIGANEVVEEDKEMEASFYMDVSSTCRLRREEAEKHPEILAVEILKAFRKELSAANKNAVSDEGKTMADPLENALQHINLLTAHVIGSK